MTSRAEDQAAKVLGEGSPLKKVFKVPPEHFLRRRLVQGSPRKRTRTTVASRARGASGAAPSTIRASHGEGVRGTALVRLIHCINIARGSTLHTRLYPPTPLSFGLTLPPPLRVS